MASETFITSDSHFFHSSIITYCRRPFVSAIEMNEALIENWNSVVGNNDTVWHLGDFALTNDLKELETILARLNGHINIIFGSHDKCTTKMKHKFSYVYPKNTIVETVINGQICNFSHTPQLSWEKRFYGVPHGFGHVHSGPFKKVLCSPGSYDVGVDNNGFTPVHFDDFLKKARSTEGKLGLDKYDETV